jgi:hypothetical protein
VDYFPF